MDNLAAFPEAPVVGSEEVNKVKVLVECATESIHKTKLIHTKL